jgi:hypothetical protein
MRTPVTIVLGALGAIAVLTATSVASAQDKGKGGGGGGGAQRGVITLAEVTITGRIQKPIAAVDVSRIQPKLTLAELRQPFLDRIEQAILKEPF